MKDREFYYKTNMTTDGNALLWWVGKEHPTKQEWSLDVTQAKPCTEDEYLWDEEKLYPLSEINRIYQFGTWGKFVLKSADAIFEMSDWNTLFLLHCHGTVGSFLNFWCMYSSGYSTDMRKAQLFYKKDLEGWMRKGIDVPIPYRWAKENTFPVIDIQDVREPRKQTHTMENWKFPGVN